MKYDLLIAGGGTSGVAAAYIASKLGIKTLLVEKSDVLGGAITQGLVVPVMKLNSENINTEFYADLLAFAKKYNAQHTFIDDNTGWFNPELLKIVFDDMLKSVKCDVLFSSKVNECSISFTDNLFHSCISHKILSLYVDTKYIIDATSNGEIFKILNCDFQNSDEKSQASSLRFMLSGVNMKVLADWLCDIDKDRAVTMAEYSDSSQIHLSTACTWDDSHNWALSPIFKGAVGDGVLERNDCAYFQVFTVPNMPNTLAVNAPRIILDDDESILDPFVYSRALNQGRERIYRLANFMKLYFKGCENSYISHISDTLGVRESYRVKGKYTFTVDDIINPKKFDNIAFASDYPVDIHSVKKDKSVLKSGKTTYYVPIECLISDNIENLYGVGRIISADFEAQAAIRTQMNCFSMGEAAAKDIKNKLI